MAVKGVALKYKILGQKKLERELQRIQKEAHKPTKGLRVASLIMYKDVIDHFRKESSPDGKWAPLKYRTGRILQDTGRLKNSITFSSNSKTAIVGTNVNYAKQHEIGNPKKHIPQRRFMWLSKTLGDRIEKAFIKYGISK